MSHTWQPSVSTLEASTDGLKLTDLSDDSKILASRLHVVHDYGTPLVQPIVQAATYRVKSVQQYQDVYSKGGYMYLRYNNPTSEAVETVINLMEKGAGSLVFASGMSAITTALLTFLKAGDHIVACNPLYGGTHEFMDKVLSRFNVETTFIDGNDTEEYRKACKPNTKVLYGETPCNPLLSILDLEKFGELGASLRAQGVITMVDTTFASSYLVKSISYGVDIVLQSGTKYLGGHSDLCAGVITTRSAEHWAELIVTRRVYGGILSPQDAALLHRGIKTIHVRMPRQCQNAQKIAEYLESHAMIERVYYPGLKSHPQHEVAKRQMQMFGGMVTFIVKGGIEPSRIFAESVRLINLAVSLGGVESLLEHPATMSHGPLVLSADERRKSHIADGLIRLSVGIEDANDLVADLKQALSKAAAALKE